MSIRSRLQHSTSSLLLAALAAFATLAPGAPLAAVDAPDSSIALTASEGNYLEVPNSSTINLTGPMTVEAWIHAKEPTSAAGQAIVERYDWLPVDDGGYALRLNAVGQVLFAIVRQANVYNAVTGNTVVPAGWHHVAGVYNGTQLQVYLDGRLDGSAATTLTPASGTAPLKIGARGNDSLATFDGWIDQVRLSQGVLYSASFAPQTNFSATPGTTMGLWTFNAYSLQDSSGNGNNAFGVNGPAFVEISPEYSSVKLPANDGAFVNVPNSPTINLTSAFTVEAWVNPEVSTSANGQAIVERFNFFTTADGGFALRLTQAGTVLFGIVRQAGVYSFVVGSTVVTPGWHHVAGVYDGSKLLVFVDGKPDGTLATTMQPAGGTSSLKIGVTGNDETLQFAGYIDEVRLTASPLYSGKFTPARHQVALAGLTRGLWRFDSGTAEDASGNGNDGALQGGASITPLITP